MIRRSKGISNIEQSILFIIHPLSVLQVLVLLVVVSEPLVSDQDFSLEDEEEDAVVVSSHVHETPLQAR